MSRSYTEGIEDSKAKFSFKSLRTVLIKDLFNPPNRSLNEYQLEMFSIYISDLVTPRTTEPTSSFKVRIYDANNFMQYKKESLAFS